MKNAIVTGAYGAIGKAIAAGLAGAGHAVTLLGRDETKLREACDSLSRATGSAGLSYAVVDLSLQSSVEAFVNAWHKPLHILINNAATAPRRREETAEGHEVQWAVNVLSYVWMINGLGKWMAGEPGARIVNVASYWAGGLDLTDPEFIRRRYDNDTAYRQAKQANRMLTAAYAGRLIEKGITVNACHPGDVNSKLSNAFGFGGSETPQEGAATPLYLALDGAVAAITGKYFEHRQQVRCSFAANSDAVEALFRLCGGLPA